MLENMQWVEGVSKWIFPAIGYGIKKYAILSYIGDNLWAALTFSRNDLVEIFTV